MALLKLPNLRWVALSRNPFLNDVIEKRASSSSSSLEILDDPILEDTKWPILGEGAGGVTRRVRWKTNNDMDVAVKTFVGELTSDGSPLDEKAISVAASSLRHESLIQLFGETKMTGSLVMEFLDGFQALAGPPSMESCSRDVYTSDQITAIQQRRQKEGVVEENEGSSQESFPWKIVQNLFHVLYQLHSEIGICHGDFYGHNILISSLTESVKLSDFGAAFFYDNKDSEYGKLLQQIELRSYGVLVNEMMTIVQQHMDIREEEKTRWKDLADDCVESTLSFGRLRRHFT